MRAWWKGKGIPMFDDDEDEPAFKKYQEQAEAVADPFRRSPHNLIEEIEQTSLYLCCR